MNEDSVMDLGKRISLCELFLLKNWDRRKHLTEKDFSLDMKCLYVFDMVIPVSDVIVDMVEDCPVGTYEEYYYKFLLYNTFRPVIQMQNNSKMTLQAQPEKRCM